MKSIWLTNKDFRLADNVPLSKAVYFSSEVLPVYIINEDLQNSPDIADTYHYTSNKAALALREELRRRDSDLYFAYGNLVRELETLKNRYPFDTLFCHEEYGSDVSRKAFEELKVWCAKNKIALYAYYRNGVVLDRQDAVKNLKTWYTRMNSTVLPAPDNLKFPNYMYVYTRNDDLVHMQVAGSIPKTVRDLELTEHAADMAMRQFLRSVNSGTGKSDGLFELLNIHLVWGTATSKQIYRSIKEEIADVQKRDEHFEIAKRFNTYINKLHWRDHFIQRYLTADSAAGDNSNNDENQLFELQENFIDSLMDQLNNAKLSSALVKLKDTGYLSQKNQAKLILLATQKLHISSITLTKHIASRMVNYEPGIWNNMIQLYSNVQLSKVKRKEKIKAKSTSETAKVYVPLFE